MLTGSCLCGRVAYEVDGKIGPVFYCHCTTCGRPKAVRSPDILRLRMGSLDGDPGRRPLAHIFVAEKVPWSTITDDLPRSQGNGDNLAR